MDYLSLKQHLENNQYKWLVTGAAGFIGSNLLETLLKLDQKVVGLDNFSSGSPDNLQQVQQLVGTDLWKNFSFFEGDICQMDNCQKVTANADYVLHQAALCSVPGSVEDPITATTSNISGFVNMLTAARDAHVKGFVYASSSAVYGDHPELPKVEESIGHQLSPYAVTKYVDELYGEVFARCYEFNSIGLRYFNVFGQRQDPDGAYAAVIPKWVSAMLSGEPPIINGDGETTRDFCYIENVTQANLLAAMTNNTDALNQVYNVALNTRISLNKLFYLIRELLANDSPRLAAIQPHYEDFRPGDVRHSQADIEKIKDLLGFEPTDNVYSGLQKSIAWYKQYLRG